MDTLEYVPLAISFLAIFWLLYFAINRTKINNGWIIALILSVFSTYGLTKLNIPIENIFYKIGFNQELLFTIGPWILLGLTMLIIWKWGFGRLFIIFGLIFLALGIFKVAAESGAAIVIGSIFLIIGLILYRRRRSKEKFYSEENIRKLEADEKREGLRRYRRERRGRRWNRAKTIGKIAGTPIKWGTQGIGLAGEQSKKQIKKAKKQARKYNKMQRQYDKYSKRINKIVSDNGGQIPSASSNPKDSAEYSRLISGMRRIEKIAERNNRNLR